MCSMITVQNIKDYEFSFKGLDAVYTAEINEHDAKTNEKVQKHKEILEIVKGLGVGKLDKMKSTECEFLLVKEYLRQRIFSCKKTNSYYIIEDGKLTAKPECVWKKYLNKIKQKGKMFVDFLEDCDELYTADVYLEEFIVDLEKHRLNLKPRLPFELNPNAKMDEEAGKKILAYMKEIITSNNDAEWITVEYFLGCAVQSKRSELVMIFQALGGVGKSFIIDNVFQQLLGDGLSRTSDDFLTGEDKFNESLIGTRCAVLEETSGSQNGKYCAMMKELKRTSTSQRMAIRKMHQASQDFLNCINYVISTNHYRDFDLSDRRIFLPTINNKYQEDIVFFAQFEKLIKTESLQYIFNHFANVNTSKRVLAPETLAKQEFKEETMLSPVKYMILELIIKHPREDYFATTRDLYEHFESWAKNNKKRCPTFALFANTVRQYVEKATKADGTEMKSHNVSLYNFSAKSLYDRIIVRSKALSKDQFEQWKFNYEKEKEQVENGELDCDFTVEKNISKEKDMKIVELEKQIAELKKLLEEKNEAVKKEKKVKFDQVLEKPIKYKKNAVPDMDLNNLLD